MIRLIVRITPLAGSDIAAQAEHIASDNPAAAARFLDAVLQASQMLAANPGLGERFGNPRFPLLRFRTIPHFRNYVVFFEPRQDELVIIRLLHASRDVNAAMSEIL